MRFAVKTVRAEGPTTGLPPGAGVRECSQRREVTSLQPPGGLGVSFGVMPVSCRPLSALACLAAVSSLLAVGSAAGSQVKRPSLTGCGEGLTQSSKDPSARLPATGIFRPSEVRVQLLVSHVTQTTRVALRAYLLDGRRADATPPGGYTCTAPGATNAIAFPVKPGLVGGSIRRHGNVKLRVRFQMVNATGRSTTLRRVITVTRQTPAPANGLG